VGEQTWHKIMLAQAGMSWHISSQQSPCIERAALLALLLNAPKAKANAIKVTKSVLHIAVM
jgi:hypothetical protein